MRLTGQRMSTTRESINTPHTVSVREVLATVPYRNEAMEIERRKDGGLLASVPIRKPKYLVPPLSWIIPFSDRRRVELDAIGASVLDLCDGKRNIEAIIEKFAFEHKLSFREAQLPVIEFLKQLAERGLVAIVGFNKDVEQE